MSNRPHIAILGGGPTGLEAALAAAEAGYPFTLYEAAPTVAGHVQGWGHVRLFTPWSLDVSPRMRKALGAARVSVPDDDTCPTGTELARQLFEPLAELPQLRDHLALGTRVRRIGRDGLLKHEEIGSAERGRRPFRLLVESGEGERIDTADLVLDCTGNSLPNTVGDAGIPAPGEKAVGDRIEHSVPDLSTDAERWAGRRTLLVGAGHSAQTALRDLVALADEHPGTEIVWALRGGRPEAPADDDPLPQRHALTAHAALLAQDPPAALEVLTGVAVDALRPNGDGVDATLRSTGRNGASSDDRTVTVDRILALTGQVGDHQLYRQLQVHECYATSGPMKLAAALLGSSGGGGDCLAQTSLGADTLKNPEPGFYILGSKSYGRRNDFLMRVGWEQVGEVFGLIEDGD